jgi:hypothetical protein
MTVVAAEAERLGTRGILRCGRTHRLRIVAANPWRIIRMG